MRVTSTTTTSLLNIMLKLLKSSCESRWTESALKQLLSAYNVNSEAKIKHNKCVISLFLNDVMIMIDNNFYAVTRSLDWVFPRIVLGKYASTNLHFFFTIYNLQSTIEFTIYNLHIWKVYLTFNVKKI